MQNNGDLIRIIKEKGSCSFVPSGNSMWPTLKNRGQSVIIGRKEERLKPFDVALFTREKGNYVLHRIMKVVSDGYVFCGDSQFCCEHVSEDKVFGVMLGFYRKGKYISCDDEDYKKEVQKLFSDEKKRKRRVKRFFFFYRLKTLPKRALRKIFGRKEGKDDGSEIDM